MNYERLFSFVAFADRLNFTQTADLLHISQPALHAKIKKLSEEIGKPLYYRKGRSLILTPEGRRLASFGREIQAKQKDVLGVIRGKNSGGPVVLASGQGAFLYLLGDAIQKFPQDKWPLRLITLPGPATIEAIRDAKADVGVAVLEQPPADLKVKRILDVGQQVVLPKTHRLAKRKKLVPSDLDGESIIVAPSGSPHRTMIAQSLKLAGVAWSVAVEATGWELMLRFTRFGMGITIVNDFCEVPSDMTGIPLMNIHKVSYFILTRTGSDSEGISTLINLIVDSAGGC